MSHSSIVITRSLCTFSHPMLPSRAKARIIELSPQLRHSDLLLLSVFDNTQSGAAVANDCIIHAGTDGLPFGGIAAEWM